ncbi:hypothetical protein HC026_00690 [Lactobacillus sp. LC28-10]|uniref:GW domain-containing protein n=1 Tax=Secundilactobacillus angelensis TaxID=2722706 RepID=A0ABX1KU31_9LACO|nr:hypothetical protein [Secundilactobacillus angelensis]MCH5461941.1 hypothetical protein [Secundilactobacillus angelensis]NLR17429.1 hypothetical protein [Secundilactobacillus angelensis]
MKSSKTLKGILLAIVTCSFIGGISLVLPEKSTSAEANPAKVVSYSKVNNSEQYQAVDGNVYSNAKLTNKVYDASNFQTVALTVTKSATVQNQQGKKTVYYYISNDSKTMSGWIWSGHLSALKKTNVNAMLKTINQPNKKSQHVNMNVVNHRVGSDGNFVGMGYTKL